MSKTILDTSIFGDVDDASEGDGRYDCPVLDASDGLVMDLATPVDAPEMTRVDSATIAEGHGLICTVTCPLCATSTQIAITWQEMAELLDGKKIDDTREIGSGWDVDWRCGNTSYMRKRGWVNCEHRGTFHLDKTALKTAMSGLYIMRAAQVQERQDEPKGILHTAAHELLRLSAHIGDAYDRISTIPKRFTKIANILRVAAEKIDELTAPDDEPPPDLHPRTPPNPWNA